MGCLARIVTRLLHISEDKELPLCSYQIRVGRQRRTKIVSCPDIVKAVKDSVRRLKLVEKGFTLKRVGSHSLRAGGAMAMILNGINETVVKRLGRWSGQTFETYIHIQIMALSNKVSEAMVQTVPNFFHIGG